MGFVNIDSGCLPARQRAPRLHCAFVLAAAVLLTSVAVGVVLALPPQASEMPRENPYAILASYGVGIFGPSNSVARPRISFMISSEVFSKHSKQIVDVISTLREPFTVDLYSIDRIDDAACSRLASIVNLVGLHLPKDGTSLEGLKVLVGSPHVRDLALCDRDMTGFDMSALRSLGSLRSLEINGAVLSNENWTQLKQAKSLETLSCENVKLTPDAWDMIRSLPGLTTLIVGGRWLTGKDIEEMSTVPRLEKVSILKSRLTAEELRPLARLPRCTVLDLSGTSAQRYSLDVVADIKELRELHWRDLADLRSDMRVLEGRSLAALGRLEHLAKLDLSDTRLDDDGIRAIASLTELRTLKIQRCNSISDAGFTEVSALRQLNELHFSSSQLTSRGLAAVSQLPCLRVLVAYGMDLSPEVLATLAASDRLEELRLSFPKQAQPLQAAEHVMAAVGQIVSLRHLTVRGLEHNAETLASLVNLTALEELDVDGSQVDGSALKALGGLRSLRILELGGGLSMKDDSVTVLQQLPQLQFVGFGWSEFSDAQLRLLGDQVVLRCFPEGTMKLPAVRMTLEFEDGEAVRVFE